MFIFMYTESLHLEKKGSGSTIKRDQIKENILHGFKIKQINYNQSGPNINVVFVAMQSKVDVISKSWAKQRLFSTFGWNYRDCCWHSGQLFPRINAIMHTNAPVIKQPRRDIYWWSNSECIKHKQKQLSEPSPVYSTFTRQIAAHAASEAWDLGSLEWIKTNILFPGKVPGSLLSAFKPGWFISCVMNAIVGCGKGSSHNSKVWQK